MDLTQMLQHLGLQEADGNPSGTEELTFDCPWCEERGEPTPDTKRRLYVNIGAKFGTFHCFRCNKSGHVHETEAQARQRYFGRSSPTQKEICAAACQKADAVKAARAAPRVAELPNDFFQVEPGMAAWDYLIGRGLTPDDIAYYNIGIGHNRIIFPDYLDDRLVFWVGRLYDEHTRGGKYFNVPGIPRKDKLYNLGRFLRAGHKQLILTEGPISAIIAGRDAIATYGWITTDEQLQILRSLPVERYYVAFDPDVKKQEAIAVARALSQTRRPVALVNMPSKMDPADIGRERFRQLLPHAAVYDMFNRTTVLNFMQPFSAWEVLEQHA